MRHLGLALFSEGRTDDRFLGPLLQRLCEDLCLKHSGDPVDVEEMLFLQNPADGSDEHRDERILRAAIKADGAWQLIFVHVDGGGAPDLQRARAVDPGLARIEEHFGARRAGVAVVPVRETEAWALTDGDALRYAFGTTLDDRSLGVPPRARQVELVTDPKDALDAAYARTGPTGRRARKGARALLQQIAQQVSLDRLREVPSFACMENELLSALRRLRIASSSAR